MGERHGKVAPPACAEGIMSSVETVEIVRRRGGWFVTGVEWSGPWASREAAELARDGEYELAHRAHRDAARPVS